MLPLSIAVVAGYLLGSLPASVLAGRLYGIDIREHGSGNAGASNVLRTLGWRPALVVLVLDVAKGAVAVWAGAYLRFDGLPVDPVLDRWLPAIAGVASVVGHVFPIWAGFRGGKGVATALGVALALAPIAGLVSLLVFIACVAVTRRISVGSIAGSVAFPVAVVALEWGTLAEVGLPTLAFGIWFAFVVCWTHRSNVRNLLRGEEPPIRSRSSAGPH